MSEKVTANAAEFVINHKVLFVTDQIGEPHGSALSAVDVVRSIPENYHKFILTSHPITSFNCLYGATSVSLFPSTIRFWAKFLPRQFLQLFDSVWALGVLIWIKFFGFDIVIVNGYGSHNLWKKIFKFIDSNAVTTVISRESPRHFDFGDFNYPLSHQIAFLRSFVSHVFVSSILSDEWTYLAALDTRRVHYLPNCCEEQPLLAIDRDSHCLSSIREEYFIDENILPIFH